MKKFVVGFLIAALAILTAGPSAAAAPSKSGFAYINLSETDFPISYPGSDNSEVDTAYFNVYTERVKNTERVGLVISCINSGGVVYSGQRTVGYGNQDVVFPVSFYVSIGTKWQGEEADCYTDLIWESVSKRDGIQFGGTLYSAPRPFQIGTP